MVQRKSPSFQWTFHFSCLSLSSFPSLPHSLSTINYVSACWSNETSSPSNLKLSGYHRNGSLLLMETIPVTRSVSWEHPLKYCLQTSHIYHTTGSSLKYLQLITTTNSKSWHFLTKTLPSYDESFGKIELTLWEVAWVKGQNGFSFFSMLAVQLYDNPSLSVGPSLWST